MKNQTALITDSTCDIPQAIISQYGITVIPLAVVWGNELFLDRVDLTPEEFYQRLEKIRFGRPQPFLARLILR